MKRKSRIQFKTDFNQELEMTYGQLQWVSEIGTPILGVAAKNSIPLVNCLPQDRDASENVILIEQKLYL